MSTLKKHSQVVATASAVSDYHKTSFKRRASILSPQSFILENFIKHYGKCNVLQFPTGMDSKFGRVVVKL